MKSIRHSGLPVVLVAILLSFSTSGRGQSPEEKRRPTLEEARKKFLDVRDGADYTALHNAAFFNNLNFARYLIKQGADVNARSTKQRYTPLHCAAYWGHLEITRLLVNAGADIDAKTIREKTALHLAISQKKYETAEALILLGADVNAKSYAYYTPLHTAALLGDLKAAELLLKYGAEVDPRELWDQTPLHIAAHYGYYEIAELLIQKGADVNAKSNVGSTPLNNAIAAKRGDVKELLLRHGAVEGTRWARKHFKPGSTRYYRVTFESRPPGARVEVGGVLVCRKTPCAYNLRAGVYQVVMQRPFNYYQTADVQVLKEQKVSWKLNKRPSKIDVLVLTKKWVTLYGKPIAAFKKAYRGKMEFKSLFDDINWSAKSIAAVQHKNPRMILTVGHGVTEWAVNNIHNIPIIFCMAFSPMHNNLKTPVSTGVTVDAPPKDQLRAFQEAIPGLRRIGVVYDPRMSGSFVLDARLAALRLGLSIVSQQVKSEHEATLALWDIARKSDALWLVRDKTAVTRDTFNHALSIQSRYRIPVLAYTETFVVEGAFASYNADYYEQGELAAQMAKWIDDGALPRDIPVQHPQGGLMINLDVAERLSSKFKVPPEVLLRGDVRKYKESWGIEEDLTVEKRRTR